MDHNSPKIYHKILKSELCRSFISLESNNLTNKYYHNLINIFHSELGAIFPKSAKKITEDKKALKNTSGTLYIKCLRKVSGNTKHKVKR